ncbi:alpha/beta hydrolase [Bradyrhizobium sp. LA6.12]|uniref:alpha/beta fold hydrolase n=1 Tax=unclassified Bradyrhizobium TaxID=2631580 RepID=UPI003391A034
MSATARPPRHYGGNGRRTGMSAVPRDRNIAAHDNPDYVDVVIHSYRHRYGLADGDPRYKDIQDKLAGQPVITVPTVTLDGDADGVIPVTDGSAHASRFSNRLAHRIVADAGHNLAQEEPEAFVQAVLDVLPAK